MTESSGAAKPEDPEIIRLLYGKSTPRRLSPEEQEIEELRREHEEMLAILIDMASGTAKAPQEK